MQINYPLIIEEHEGLLIREGNPNYSIPNRLEVSKFGTFAESKRAPIHRWFQYPAGFSYRAVEYILDLHNITTDHLVYDPFTGTGTTNVVCKGRKIKSIGVEAHPFVQKVAQVKTTWDLDLRSLQEFKESFLLNLNFSALSASINLETVPELVRKCFSDKNLRGLLNIREEIGKIKDENFRNLFSLALTCALRRSSSAATGWPYISPKKKIFEKDGLKCFTEQINEMVQDLSAIPEEARLVSSNIIKGDARSSPLADESLDLSFTSPPYLNNYDYADRTRLEVYFNGLASTWSEITDTIREKLIISATTQIRRGSYNEDNLISDQLGTASKRVANVLRNKILELKKLRGEKGGKKSYDLLVAGYFNDMTLALLDNYRVLKPGSCFVLILGDSAPYGVYIPVDEMLGEIGLGVGFKDYSIYKLRERGNKWRANPQRHHVLLRESILTLRK
ncbi:MAG: hypothetical protein NTW14_00785 [bacterium]|nr:hypothetical protein [bacterium]